MSIPFKRTPPLARSSILAARILAASVALACWLTAVRAADLAAQSAGGARLSMDRLLHRTQSRRRH